MSSSEKRSKQTKSSSFRKDRLILFLTGCALGVACFLWVYGAKIVNPLYDAWIFNTDMDLKQHYIGWCHYRMSDWHFPVGLIDTLSYPTSVSVIYTDSIPIVALIFKLFRDVLPVRFQYFGMFGLLSFMLMGGISSLLVYELISPPYSQPKIAAGGVSPSGTVRGGTERDRGRFSFLSSAFIVSAAASLVFILSFTVLQRMFYHTALGAQWIIVLALYIWARRRSCGNPEYYDSPAEMAYRMHGSQPGAGNEGTGKNVLTSKTCGSAGMTMVYALMGVLCVCIHTYFIPMVGSILLAASVEKIVKSKQDLTKQNNDKSGLSAAGQPSGKEQTETEQSGTKQTETEQAETEQTETKTGTVIMSEIISLVSFCIAGVLTLFIFGGFYGASSGYGEGFGSFISNLNTFINPIYGSVILKPMKLYYIWQYEGYGYLGAGVLLCILIIIAALIYNRKKPEDRQFPVFAFLLLIVDFGLAVFPLLTFSDIKIIGIPLPESLRRVLGIFRSNGRFIWVPVYLIMTGAIVYTYRLLSGLTRDMRKGKSILVKAMLLLVLIQVLDTTKVVKEKQEYFKRDQAYTNIWTKAPFPAGDIRYREFAFLYNANDIMMDTAFYAYLTGRCLNNYYYARNIDNEVNANIASLRSELQNGLVRDDTIYIFTKDDPLIEALQSADSGGTDTAATSVDAENGTKGSVENKTGQNKLMWYEPDENHVVMVRQ